MKLLAAFIVLSFSFVNSNPTVMANFEEIRVVLPPQAEHHNNENDILPFEDQDDIPTRRRRKRVALTNTHRHWTGGLVPYRLQDGLTSEETTALEAGIADVEAHTCVDFYNKDTEGASYSPPFSEFLLFQSGSTCVSQVGRTEENQEIRACDKEEIAIHELLHSLGLYHEHTHKDRDNVVQIRFNNIITGKFDQFEKQDATDIEAGLYSKSSVMHYWPHAFSKNGYRTIAALDGYFPTVHDDTWNAYKQVNELYNCSDGCSLNCEHEGYPFNTGGTCNCECPEGFSEDSLCSGFATGVIGTFVSVDTDTTTISLADLADGTVQSGTTYMWVVEAPLGYRLLVDFTDLEVAASGNDCVSSLAIRRRNLALTDNVVCGSGAKGTIFSDKNVVALILKSGSSDDVLEAEITRKQESDWCYNMEDKGETYNGNMNRTVDNSACLNWALTTECEDFPLNIGDLPADYSGNKCRNPRGKRAGPWCFVNINEEGCDIRYCDACGYGRVYDTYTNCAGRLQTEIDLCNTLDGLFGCRKTCNQTNVAVTSASSCPFPLHPITGSTIIGDIASSYAVGSSVTYQCDSNTDITRERFCLSTGEWSTLNAVCGGEIHDTVDNCGTLALDPGYCTTSAAYSDCARTCHHETECTLPSPPEGSKTEKITVGSSIRAGQTGQYRCRQGYTYGWGDEQRTCRSNGTLSGEMLICIVGAQRTTETCDVTDPGSSDHVTCLQSAGTIESGMTLDCQCDDRYTQVSGNGRRVCVDGVLAGQQPGCEEITCDTTSGENMHNTVTGTETTISPDTSVTYVCNEGYSLVYGNLIRTCTEDGILTGHAPICAEVFCNVPLAAPGSNAVRQSNIVRVGEEAQYACVAGYQHTSGDLQRVCDESLELSGNLPSCSVIECPVEQPPNEDLVSLLTTISPLPVGISARYECTSGHLVVGTLVRECQSDGLLAGSSPICSDDQCGVPDLPGANVQRNSPSAVLVNEHATYSCLPGFVLVSGNLDRTCGTGGSLSGNAPQCNETRVCVDFNDVCGAILNFLPSMCTEVSGSTSNCPATCGNCLHNDTSCEVTTPSAEDGVSVVDAATSLHPGQVVDYQCDAGKKLAEGDLIRACRLDGSLTGKSPKCSSVSFVQQWLNRLGRMEIFFNVYNHLPRLIFGPSEYTTIKNDGLLTNWRFYCHATGNVRFVVIRRFGSYPEHNYMVIGHTDYLCHKGIQSTYHLDDPIPVLQGDVIGFVDFDGGNLYYNFCSKTENNYTEVHIGSWLPAYVVTGFNFTAFTPNQGCWMYSLSALIAPAEASR